MSLVWSLIRKNIYCVLSKKEISLLWHFSPLDSVHFLLSNVHYPKENNIKLMLFPFWIIHKAISFLFRFYYSLFFSTFFNRRVQESEACNKTLDFIALNRVHTHNLALILPFYWGASLAISNCINHHTKANTIFQGVCKRTIEVWIYCKLQIRGDTIHINS